MITPTKSRMETMAIIIYFVTILMERTTRYSRHTGCGRDPTLTMIASTIRLVSLCCAAGFFASSLNAAQTGPTSPYPTKPIRFIVPYPPDAGTDTTARVIAAKLG